MLFTLHLKRGVPDSQLYSLNLCLINNLEDVVVLLTCKVFEFGSFLPVPFTFKVKNMDNLLNFNVTKLIGALYELNITSTVPLETMDKSLITFL